MTPISSERVRSEFVDWFRPPAGAAPAGANRYNFFGSQLRFGAKVTVPHVDVVVVGQYTQLVNLPDDASVGTPFGNLGPGALYFFNSPHLDRDNTNQGAVFLKEGYVTLRDLPGVQGLWLKRAHQLTTSSASPARRPTTTATWPSCSTWP